MLLAAQSAANGSTIIAITAMFAAAFALMAFKTIAIEMERAKEIADLRRSVAALRAQLQREGMTTQAFRDRLRDQLLLTRLREREVEGRVRISDAEVEQYLAEQQRNNDPASQVVNLAHILIAVPENADAQQQRALEAKAERVETTIDGKPWKIFYGSQVGTAPPTFMLFATKKLPQKSSLRRFLENFLRRELELGGVPIRLVIRERRR